MLRLDKKTNVDLRNDFRTFAGELQNAPYVIAQIYGRSPDVFPMRPYNANETGNSKVEDIQGTKPTKSFHRTTRTILDNRGGLGDSLPSVTNRYVQALKDAEKRKLPLIAAKIYTGPAVKLPQAPYDVANNVKNDAGMLGRIYTPITPEKP